MKTYKAIIQKCSGEHFWYNDKIGQSVTVADSPSLLRSRKVHLIEDVNKHINKGDLKIIKTFEAKTQNILSSYVLRELAQYDNVVRNSPLKSIIEKYKLTTLGELIDKVEELLEISINFEVLSFPKRYHYSFANNEYYSTDINKTVHNLMYDLGLLLINKMNY
jgi:hypothetical protein